MSLLGTVKETKEDKTSFGGSTKSSGLRTHIEKGSIKDLLFSLCRDPEIDTSIAPVIPDYLKPSLTNTEQRISFVLQTTLQHFTAKGKEPKEFVNEVNLFLRTQNGLELRNKRWDEDFTKVFIEFVFNINNIRYFNVDSLCLTVEIVIAHGWIQGLSEVGEALFCSCNSPQSSEAKESSTRLAPIFHNVTPAQQIKIYTLAYLCFVLDDKKDELHQMKMTCFAILMGRPTDLHVKKYRSIADFGLTSAEIDKLSQLALINELKQLAKTNILATNECADIFYCASKSAKKQSKLNLLATTIQFSQDALVLQVDKSPLLVAIERIINIHTYLTKEIAQAQSSLDEKEHDFVGNLKHRLQHIESILPVAKTLEILFKGEGEKQKAVLSGLLGIIYSLPAKSINPSLPDCESARDDIEVQDIAFRNLIRLGINEYPETITTLLGLPNLLFFYLRRPGIKASIPLFLAQLTKEQLSKFINNYLDQYRKNFPHAELKLEDAWLLPFFEDETIRKQLNPNDHLLLFNLYLKTMEKNAHWRNCLLSDHWFEDQQNILEFRQNVMLESELSIKNRLTITKLALLFDKLLVSNTEFKKEYVKPGPRKEYRLVLKYISYGFCSIVFSELIPLIIDRIQNLSQETPRPTLQIANFISFLLRMVEIKRITLDDLISELSGVVINKELLDLLHRICIHKTYNTIYVDFLCRAMKLDIVNVNHVVQLKIDNFAAYENLNLEKIDFLIVCFKHTKRITSPGLLPDIGPTAIFRALDHTRSIKPTIKLGSTPEPLVTLSEHDINKPETQVKILVYIAYKLHHHLQHKEHDKLAALEKELLNLFDFQDTSSQFFIKTDYEYRFDKLILKEIFSGDDHDIRLKEEYQDISRELNSIFERYIQHDYPFSKDQQTTPDAIAPLLASGSESKAASGADQKGSSSEAKKRPVESDTSAPSGAASPPTPFYAAPPPAKKQHSSKYAYLCDCPPDVEEKLLLWENAEAKDKPECEKQLVQCFEVIREREQLIEIKKLIEGLNLLARFESDEQRGCLQYALLTLEAMIQSMIPKPRA